MAKPPVSVDMNIGSGRIIYIPVPFGIADYFGIAASTIPETQTIKKRKPFTRSIRSRDDLTSTVIKTVTVPGAEYYGKDQLSGGSGQGKLIKLPTQVLMVPTDVKSAIRIVSMRIPAVATNFVISQWIKTKFTKRVPGYFISQSGAKYSTNVAPVADPNPGNQDPTPTP